MNIQANLPCGLANLGNTCFLNSCIQLLNYTHEIFESMKTKVSTAECYLDDQFVFNEWIELRNIMFDVRGRVQNPVVQPGKFVHTIHRIAVKKGRELFTGWAQNDLTEFLLFMIDCIHNTRRRSINVDICGIRETPTDDLALQCYSMSKDMYERENDYSEVSEVFYGVYVSRLFTPDGSILHSNKPESYCILDLPIPPLHTNNKQISLLSCFDTFVADELLLDWFNEKTNTREPVRKNIVFWNFPKVLMITLKRFYPDGQRKNNVLVDFPLDSLDLSKYVVGYNANTYKYKLFGVANHMGGISGGHYTAFVLNGDDWYCFNDASVCKINPGEVISSSAYCLFYRKK